MVVRGRQEWVKSTQMGAGPDSTRTNYPISSTAAYAGFVGARFSLPRVVRNVRIFIGYFVCGYAISTRNQVALIASE
jgi:hypothetical protein